MMRWRMRTPRIDNSSVNTRQVRRYRERLAKKDRNDVIDQPPFAWSTSRYRPHCGLKERAKHLARREK